MSSYAVIHPDCDTAPVKEQPMWHHEQGLSTTATGYGMKLPQPWMVLYENRWRRVYASCYSNVARLYIHIKGLRHTVTLYI